MQSNHAIQHLYCMAFAIHTLVSPWATTCPVNTVQWCHRCNTVWDKRAQISHANMMFSHLSVKACSSMVPLLHELKLKYHIEKICVLGCTGYYKFHADSDKKVIKMMFHHSCKSYGFISCYTLVMSTFIHRQSGVTNALKLWISYKRSQQRPP